FGRAVPTARGGAGGPQCSRFDPRLRGTGPVTRRGHDYGAGVGRAGTHGWRTGCRGRPSRGVGTAQPGRVRCAGRGGECRGTAGGEAVTRPRRHRAGRSNSVGEDVTPVQGPVARAARPERAAVVCSGRSTPCVTHCRKPRTRHAALRRVGSVAGMNDNEAADFDAVYRGESPIENMTSPPWDIGEPQPAMTALVRAGRVHGPVLDAGCGTGDTSLYLAECGFTVTGVDGSPTAIAAARDKAHHR